MATVEELLQPIPGPNPSGENVRYTPQFDKLKESRRAGGDWLSEGGTIDYTIIIKQSEDFLLKKTKDLQVAVWLLEAWMKKQGFTGFKNGLQLMYGLIDTFWDTVYPELEDGDAGLRLAPLDWLGAYLDLPLKQIAISKGGHTLLQYKESQMVGKSPDPEKQYDDPEWENKKKAYDAAVADGKLSGDDFEAGFLKSSKDYYVDLLAELDSILELLDNLQVLSEQKFTDEPPSFSKVRVALEEVRLTVNSLLDQKRALEPDEGADEASAEEEQGESGSDEGVEETRTVTVAVKKKKSKVVAGMEPDSLEEVGERLSAIATWLRAQDPQNPSSYLLLRGYRWGEVRAGGSIDPVILEPPTTEQRTTIKRLSLEGDWEGVLTNAELVMSTPAGRGWLDLQRYAAQACENLYYSYAANAIRSELKALLLDLPDLLNMTLMDDTPTANAETQAWIKEFILPPPPPEPVPETPQETYYQPEPEPEPVPQYSYPQEDNSSTNGEPRPPDAFELAQEALRNGDKEQAVEILVREMAQERSGRARFMRKMQLSQICLSMGKQVVAKPILEDLAGEVEKRRLDEWEAADTVAHALVLLYRCMEDGERKQQLYNWICRLDPVQALACSK
jgi:type VI secretion system protein ImpA